MFLEFEKEERDREKNIFFFPLSHKLAGQLVVRHP